jgi:hypothetical protein
MTRANYGSRQKGSSKFVVVAPHAAGDDTRTKEIAEAVARHLNASLVVNEKYIKPSNSRASTSSTVEDFNKLSWSRSHERYLWNRKHPHMKEFYDHIAEYAKHAREQGDGRAIVVYIHGMKDGDDGVGIDIGFGAKYHEERLKGTRGRRDKHPDCGTNSGVVRANREDMEKLKTTLEDRLSTDHGLSAGIAEATRYDSSGRKIEFAAWSKQNGVQYHNGPTEHSFQLEISSLLRRPGNVAKTARMIADALKEVYRP